MSARTLLAMPGNETMAAALSLRLEADWKPLEVKRFPDNEVYVRITKEVTGGDVDIVCTLARADEQFLALAFAAGAVRELGAARVNLIAPYLAYMRQDARFKPGEAIASRHFAQLLSQLFDSLITVDPHLHRWRGLDQIFAIPTRIAHAAPLLAKWISAHVEAPLIVGPDAESLQWVTAVAKAVGAPHVLMSKVRRGDRDVTMTAPDLSAWRDKTPVLIDDMASSGRTMIEAASHIKGQGLTKPYCLVVHALFSDASYAALADQVASVVSTDTIAHASNQISVADILATAVLAP